MPNAKNAKKTCQIICFYEKSAFPFCYGAAQCWDTDAITQKRWKVKVHVQTSALLLLQKMVMNLFNKTHNRWNPNQSYLNFYLSFSETVTPGAKVSATELPTQRAMRNPAKPLLKTMSRMVISIKVLERIYLKVHIFWEGPKILQNLHLRFVLCSNGQIYGGDFAKFCGLLRIYELYNSWQIWIRP